MSPLGSIHWGECLPTPDDQRGWCKHLEAVQPSNTPAERHLELVSPRVKPVGLEGSLAKPRLGD